MLQHTEAKPQGWQATAVLEDGTECLLLLGRSTTQVRDGYAAAFAEVLTDEERGRVRRVALRSWQGAPDRGRWVAMGTLPVPTPAAAGRQSLLAAA